MDLLVPRVPGPPGFPGLLRYVCVMRPCPPPVDRYGGISSKRKNNQVLRDVDLDAAVAMEEGNLVAAREAQQTWLHLAMEEWKYLMTGTLPDRATGRPRAKAYKWLVAVDAMLQQAGLSLAKYLLHKEPIHRGPAEEWPVLTLSLDQGSDGWLA